MRHSAWQEGNRTGENPLFGRRSQKCSPAGEVAQNLAKLVPVHFKSISLGKVLLEAHAAHPQPEKLSPARRPAPTTPPARGEHGRPDRESHSLRKLNDKQTTLCACMAETAMHPSDAASQLKLSAYDPTMPLLPSTLDQGHFPSTPGGPGDRSSP